ncbi:MAG: hypothetical protein NZ517_04170, partial [Candidatus Nitrosocaldus sp.]|nr:hypothetical protein [Candidatus Nitrosocaldus sp.]
WNIGEVIGALDRARRLGRIQSDELYATAKRMFLLDVKRLGRTGMMLVLPIRMSILKESWKLVEKHHVYLADALRYPLLDM